MSKELDIIPRICSSTNFKPQRLDVVVFCSGRPAILQNTLPWNLKQVDSALLVACVENARCSEIATAYGVQRIITKGSFLETALSVLTHPEWYIFIDDDILLPSNFREVFNSRNWNPKFLYTATRIKSSLQFNGNAQGLVFYGDVLGKVGADLQYRGYFQMFHARADELKCWENGDCLTQRWPNSKRCLISLDVIQLLTSRSSWKQGLASEFYE